ncbi:MAG: cupin domain-containing protein [Deltaproteobacteria bacterium]|nr:cupin domain-containing protein [Deltaproteobacteria bacterium]
MERIEVDKLPARVGALYPKPHAKRCARRKNTALGDAAGLTQFGVNLTRLKPGVWSSQRHWHTREDEFVWVLEGDVTLVTDGGRETLRAGDCAGFPAGIANGHHFINEGAVDAVFLTVGARHPKDACHYPDIDMHAKPGRFDDRAVFVHKDGSPFPAEEG